MARTSLEHSFLPGNSLWAKPDNFTTVNSACTGQIAGSGAPSSRCRTFLDANEKAAEQWDLERRYHAFEAEQH
jgi:adenosine deaminase